MVIVPFWIICVLSGISKGVLPEDSRLCVGIELGTVKNNFAGGVYGLAGETYGRFGIEFGLYAAGEDCKVFGVLQAAGKLL